MIALSTPESYSKLILWFIRASIQPVRPPTSHQFNCWQHPVLHCRSSGVYSLRLLYQISNTLKSIPLKSASVCLSISSLGTTKHPISDICPTYAASIASKYSTPFMSSQICSVDLYLTSISLSQFSKSLVASLTYPIRQPCTSRVPSNSKNDQVSTTVQKPRRV